MSNLRHLNQPNPFWDWISQFDSAGSSHPFFNAYNPDSRPSHGPPHHGGHPAPPHHDGPPPLPPQGGSHNPEHHSPPPHSHPSGPGFPFGGGNRGPNHHGGHGSRRGSCGPQRAGGRDFGDWPAASGAAFDISKIAEFISQFIPKDAPTTTPTPKDPNTFTPPADIFSTPDAYIIHLSLPGARKEDVGVNWDADKSELSVAGVIYRPGDEEFLKTLALDEREIGVFERKIRLGAKGDEAQVDSDGLAAKMEDGVLVVTVPKLDADIVEVRKVDIE